MIKPNKIIKSNSFKNSFWKPVKQNPKPTPLFGFNLNPKPSHPFGLKTKQPVSPVKLAIYPKRTSRETRLIDKNPFGDRDRDKVPNWFDCKPLNKRKQAKIGIVGSRQGNEQQKKLLEKFLDKKFNKEKDCIVSGGCYAGADKWAKDWAVKNKAQIIEHLSKGYRPQDFRNRNKLIANESEKLIGVVMENANPKRFAGTEQTVREAIERNIPVSIITPKEIIQYSNKKMKSRDIWNEMGSIEFPEEDVEMLDKSLSTPSESKHLESKPSKSESVSSAQKLIDDS